MILPHLIQVLVLQLQQELQDHYSLWKQVLQLIHRLLCRQLFQLQQKATLLVILIMILFIKIRDLLQD
nr:MAG TPA: hypothetical protein [Caudoviricetes sp.]